MSKLVCREEQNIIQEIKNIEKCIKIDKEMLIEILKIEDYEYVCAQETKLKDKIKEREDIICFLNKRREDLLDGKLTNELTNTHKEEMNKIEEMNKMSLKKKMSIINKKKEQSKLSKEFYEKNRKAKREDKYLNNSKEYSNRHFNNTIANLPEYMKKKLSNMPNNKGYFWKSVIFYGDLPKERGRPVTVFDKNKNLFIIHEWTDKTYSIYHKDGNERKKLYKRVNRKKLF